MTTLTGKEFNEKYLDKTFVKLTNKDENHNGYEFRSGLNEDTVAFNPEGSCRAGGIYFCDLGKLPIWLDYGDKCMYYARLVSIPDDAWVYEEEDKWKADRLVLGERQTIGELEIWKDREYCLRAVGLKSNILDYVQTEALCLAAVKQNGMALRYVRDQTEEICMEAVKENGYALVYVGDQTEEMCMEAVKQNGVALQYVRDQTKKICMEAVRQNGWALAYVKSQTEIVCREAVFY